MKYREVKERGPGSHSCEVTLDGISRVFKLWISDPGLCGLKESLPLGVGVPEQQQTFKKWLYHVTVWL